MIEGRPIVDTGSHSETRNPVSRMMRYVARVITTFAVAIVRGIVHSVWHLAYVLLCLFRPITYLFLPAAFIMLLLSVAAFVKPEASPAMPAWAILLMAIGFGVFSVAYAAFVDWIRPPGTMDPAVRFRHPDWR